MVCASPMPEIKPFPRAKKDALDAVVDWSTFVAQCRPRIVYVTDARARGIPSVTAPVPEWFVLRSSTRKGPADAGG